MRIQVQGSLGITKYSGVIGSLKTIFKEEGVGGLFKGLSPALMTVPLFWGIYFFSYDYLKETLAEREFFHSHPMVSHIVSAVVAGGIGDVITNPFWVTRTRIQTLALHSNDALHQALHLQSRHHPHGHQAATSSAQQDLAQQVQLQLQRQRHQREVHLSGALAMIKHIYRTEGLMSFYKGLNASFLGLSHVALQFPLCQF